MRQLYPGSNLTLMVELRALAASGRIEELGARIRSTIQLGRLTNPFWFDELLAHGYAAAAEDLADRSLAWFEGSTSDWRQDPNQSVIYGRFLGRAGRWDEAQAVLEDILKAVPQHTVPHNNAALELAYVLASQGHRDQAFEAVALTQYSDDLVVRAWVEAALGERERAMELLRENGSKPGSQGIHAGVYWLRSMRDYPPFQEFFGVTE